MNELSEKEIELFSKESERLQEEIGKLFDGIDVRVVLHVLMRATETSLEGITGIDFKLYHIRAVLNAILSILHNIERK